MIVSYHAIQRFQARWRPELTLEEAGAELEQLAHQAHPTRTRSLQKDAQLYVVMSRGKEIAMLVRDNCVITVLKDQALERREVSFGADPELTAESEDDVAACRAMVLARKPTPPPAALRLPTPTERSRKANAERTLKQYAAGEHITQNAVIRAQIVLERWKKRFGDAS